MDTDNKGVTSDKLKKQDLKLIAKKMKLATDEVIDSLGKKELLEIVQKWEAEQIALAEAKDTGELIAGTDSKEDDGLMFEGKKVVKVEQKTINNKTYDEITTLDGCIYLSPLN